MQQRCDAVLLEAWDFTRLTDTIMSRTITCQHDDMSLWVKGLDEAIVFLGS